MVHEFEGIAFADPTTTARVLLAPARAQPLQQERDAFDSAESVNEGQNTHPSKRLLNHFPGYRKAAFGPTVAERIGIARIRDDCPHLDGWLDRLESL